jgi:hypothetical protein
LPVQDWSFSSSLAVVALFQVDSAVAVVQVVAAVVVGAVAAAVEENEVFNFRLHLQTFIRFRIKPRSCRMQ